MSSKFAFEWKSPGGLVEYDTVSEKWMLDGSDEGHMSPKLALILARAVTENYPPMTRLRDIVDEAFGLQPPMTDDELLTFIEGKLAKTP